MTEDKQIGNEPAYPHTQNHVNMGYAGITIRQQACLMAMKGILANHNMADPHSETEWISKAAVKCADAVLAEEERTRKK